MKGRWTKKEHEAFVTGYNRFGKSWKKIAEMVPSRSLVQIRSHAQKYLLKKRKDDPQINPMFLPSPTQQHAFLLLQMQAMQNNAKRIVAAGNPGSLMLSPVPGMANPAAGGFCNMPPLSPTHLMSFFMQQATMRRATQQAMANYSNILAKVQEDKTRRVTPRVDVPRDVTDAETKEEEQEPKQAAGVAVRMQRKKKRAFDKLVEGISSATKRRKVVVALKTTGSAAANLIESTQ
jgi:SHAQKYF class myb-like DNA-binding protein